MRRLLLTCYTASAFIKTETKRNAAPLRAHAAVDAFDELRRLAALRPTKEHLAQLTLDVQGSAGVTRFLRKERRYGLLVELLERDGEEYRDTAGWLHAAMGVPRADLPNLEGVPALAPALEAEEGLVPDCGLPNATFAESPLDAFLLAFTRDRYAVHTPGPRYRSARPGILGLLDEMRALMLDERGSDAAQADVVLRVLLDLMTPALPPFYRIFMGGLAPSEARGDPAWLRNLTARQSLVKPGGRVLERLPFLTSGDAAPVPFYAPFLTSVVAPVVFGFLVGPARINRRADGRRGGLVVDKCKFLQESNCKGLCLHSCKRPAEQLFDDLGVPLRVMPNFETQECQWSWGVEASEPADDPAWPDACLSRCPNRLLLPRSENEGVRTC